MSIKINKISQADNTIWDTYVNTHPKATLYHLSAWKNIIEKTYGHKTYYLMAVNSSQLTDDSSQLKVEDPPYSGRTQRSEEGSRTDYEPSAISYQLNPATDYQLTANSYELNPDNVVGILPLVHLKHFLFGNSLISIPFFDIGGILANNEETEKALISEAIKLGQELKANNIELRHIEPLTWLGNSSQLIGHSSKEEPGTASELSATHAQWNPAAIPSGSYDLGCGAAPELPPTSHQLSTMSYATKSHKVRMLLALPESSEALIKSFKSKLRSQIKKPIKEGLKSKVGGLELLDDFYKVFSINMRDLGSPLHSRKLIKHVLEEFSEKARIVLVYKDSEPIACSIIVGFNDTLENPWASALRQYSRLSPNMLLYWTMLEYAC